MTSIHFTTPTLNPTRKISFMIDHEARNLSRQIGCVEIDEIFDAAYDPESNANGLDTIGRANSQVRNLMADLGVMIDPQVFMQDAYYMAHAAQSEMSC